MLAWEVWEAGSQPAPCLGRGWGAQRGGWRIRGWSCCWRSRAASRGLLHADGPRQPPPRPRGTPTSKWDGNGAPVQRWLDLSPFSPSLCHHPSGTGLVSPSVSSRPALSCEGARLPRRGERFADLRLFSQLPRHILSGSHVCRSQALLSWLPAAGPAPGWKQHPDGAIFSHF